MIALACDHGGFEMMEHVKSFLDSEGLVYNDFGTYSAESCDYPEFAIAAGRAIAGGECDKGIFICSTGIGMSMAANKISGIRAGLCSDRHSAEMTRRHNNANVLALGAHIVDLASSLEIIRVFLNTEFDNTPRHIRRVAMLDALDAERDAGR